MFDYILSLGGTVFIPIIMIVIGLIFRVPRLQAIKAGVTVGISFIGMGLVIAMTTDSLNPPIKVMIEHFGLALRVFDIGAGPASGVGYVTAIGAMIIPAILPFNVVMLVTRLTRTMNVDIYNCWHYAITGTVVQLMTGSLICGMLRAICRTALSLKMADWTTRRIQSIVGLEDILTPQSYGSSSVPLFVLLDVIYKKISFMEGRNIDTQEIQKRCGMVGDPVITSIMLGLILGLAAGGGFKGCVSLAITVAAIMVLFPRMVRLIVEGLMPISDDARKFFQRCFKEREVCIDLDTAMTLGHPTIIAVGLLLIPIMLILASVLPGNKVLPLADLSVAPFFICMATVIHRGDLAKTLISGATVMITVLLIATQLASYFAEMALRGGFSFAGESVQISALSVGNMSGRSISELISFGITDVVVAVGIITSVVLLLRKRELSEQGVLSMNWLKEVIGAEGVAIVMCHLHALSGDPNFDTQLEMSWVIGKAWDDLMAFQNGGVDAVMFSNEFSLPYLTKVHPEITAAMARIIRQLISDIHIPLGVNVLQDSVTSFDLAMATGAKFIREMFTSVYASDFGVWNTNVGETIRHQHRISTDEVKVLFNIVPEAAVYLNNRDICPIVRSTVFNNHPDALYVSGLTAGTRTDSALLERIKKTVPDTVVLASTDVCLENMEKQLSITGGCVTATTFKRDSVFTSFVDQTRVSQFMEKVYHIRR